MSTTGTSSVYRVTQRAIAVAIRASVPSSTRFLVRRSVIRPMTGVAATAASRFAVSTQLTAISETLSWSAITPSSS